MDLTRQDLVRFAKVSAHAGLEMRAQLYEYNGSKTSHKFARRLGRNFVAVETSHLHRMTGWIKEIQETDPDLQHLSVKCTNSACKSATSTGDTVVVDPLIDSIRFAVRNELTFDCGVLVDGAVPVDWDEVVSKTVQLRVKQEDGTDTDPEVDSGGRPSSAADDGR